MPFNYKSNTSHMLIETVDLTVIPISEASLIGLQKDSKAKSELNQEVSGSVTKSLDSDRKAIRNRSYGYGRTR